MRILSVLAIALACTPAVLGQGAQPAVPVTQGNTSGQSQRLNGRAGQTPFRPWRSAPVPSASEIPPNAPVVTLDGICEAPHKAAKNSPCQTVITRAELDNLVDTLMPEASQNVRGQFAINYARMLAAAAVAERRHLGENPAVAKAIRAQQSMARMQVLSSTLYKTFQTDAANVTPIDVQDYYKRHTADYQQGELERLVLPKSAMTETGKPLDLAVAKSVAEAMRARAAAGEDINQLQQEAYKKLAIQSGPPPVRQITVRREDLAPDQAKLFEQKPGEVSEVFDAPGAFLFQKLVSKKAISLDEARLEIQSKLRQQRLQQSLHQANQTVTAEFNLKYFDMTSTPDLFPPPGLGQLATRPRITSNFRPGSGSPAGFPRASLLPQR